MTHNQIDGGNELLIGTRDNAYVYNTVTGTLHQNAGVALQSVDFLNQRILGVDVGRRFWRYSGLADATSWNTLDNESAESSPDRIVGGIVSQGEWLVFGERTIEVWRNDPTQDTAFQRSEVIERGCRNADTIKRLDNTVFFVDNNGIPVPLERLPAVPIGSKAIIQLIAECDPAKLFAFTWEDKGYAVYYITGKDGKTLGYDVTSGKWHRRQSFGLDRWRLNTLVQVERHVVRRRLLQRQAVRADVGLCLRGLRADAAHVPHGRAAFHRQPHPHPRLAHAGRHRAA
jgi:hypothetical protein